MATRDTSAYAKAYYLANKDKIRAHNDSKKKERQEYNKKWRLENKVRAKELNVRWRLQNPTYKANPAKRNFNTTKRRAAKLNATPKWLTKYQIEGIRLNYQLAQYVSALLGVQMVVDHIIPLQGKDVCGLHVPWNLQIMEKIANISKGNSYE